MSEFLSALWVPSEQRMACADFTQHSVSWDECDVPYDNGHEFTWPTDDNGSSIRIRALGDDGRLLEPGCAEYEVMRADILRLWPTRGELFCYLLKRIVGDDGILTGNLNLGGVRALDADALAILQTIREVGGSLDAGSLTSAKGAFPALASVGGSLDARSLTSAEGAFPALASVGGSLYARSLTSAEGAFPALASVGGSLYARSLTSAARQQFAKRIGA
jgi:hypothetical protein